jgi:hypothetical protein
MHVDNHFFVFLSFCRQNTEGLNCLNSSTNFFRENRQTQMMNSLLMIATPTSALQTIILAAMQGSWRVLLSERKYEQLMSSALFASEVDDESRSMN